MYQKQINDKESGQRLDKYLHKLLPLAGTSFLYKMLRKKNITLNGKKADGSEKITTGDAIAIFFSDETLAKFMGSTPLQEESNRSKQLPVRKKLPVSEYQQAYQKFSKVKVLYENEHLLLADKPVGILTQKASPSDSSLNEWLIGYLLHSHFLAEADLQTFKPSVCNRLDRNTSGIVLCAKSIRGAQLLGELLQERTLEKYYQLYVKGILDKEQLMEGYLIKDERRNKVSVGKEAPQEEAVSYSYIKTYYKPLAFQKDKTLLEVELLTGKPHQIRAHLASIGHPLLGDYKYGDRVWNDHYRKKYHITSQLLHAYKIVFPILNAPFEDISGRTFCTDIPLIFQQLEKED